MVAPEPEDIKDSRTTPETPEPEIKEEPRHSSDLYVRTSLIDASLALTEFEKGKIDGSRKSLWMRSWIQEQFFALGSFLQADAGKVLFVAILALLTFCVGLKSAQIHTRVDQLWVPEGGRLDAELHYTLETLGEVEFSTHQLLIQTARDDSSEDTNVLTARALLDHLRVLEAASKVTVHLYDIDWSLKNLCYSPSVPEFEGYNIEMMIDKIMPCALITPLDCFWEGSKLHGPENPIIVPGLNDNIQWSSLNPVDLVEKIKHNNYTFNIQALETYMKRAGITTGYTEKPCLDPSDPECPDSAPNKKSKQPVNVGEILSDGCYGLASSFMHWPEKLIIGGMTRNSSGAPKSARALQSVVQLMGAKETYDFWADHYKVHHFDWTPETASAVLLAWQRKFSQEVKRVSHEETAGYEYYPFSTASLDDILAKFTIMPLRNYVIGFLAMVALVGFSLWDRRNPEKSQAALGIAGVLILALGHAAGLGLCALLGIPFNAWTLSLVPWLAMSLGCAEVTRVACGAHDVTGAGSLLRRVGPPLVIHAIVEASAFLAASAIPAPALKALTLQLAILLVFNAACNLLVFPALISLELRRRIATRSSEPLCCCAPIPAPPETIYKHKQCKLSPEMEPMQASNDSNKKRKKFLKYFLKTYYAPLLTKPTVKVLTVISFIILTLASCWSATKLTDGLDLTDIIPDGTNEHKFLRKQQDYFGFYDMYAVTKGDFEYPTNQRLLQDYHDQFVRVPNIVKNDDGGLPKFWLKLFRNWLMELQKAFDEDFASGKITTENWYHNASDDGVLAYKLLVQTGHVDNPIDKGLATRTKLVDADGIINPKAFYNYLSAWASNDVLAYGASQANLRPYPKRWFHVKSDVELRVPKSSPLIYAASPFYVAGLSDARKATATVTAVRELCAKFEAKGLPNFPSGIPFLYWEQYLFLRPTITFATLCVSGMVFLGAAVMTLNWRASIITWFTVCSVVLQQLALMSILGIRLCALTGSLCVIAGAVVARTALQTSTNFVTAIGTHRRRTRLAICSTTESCTKGLPAAALATGAIAVARWAPVADSLLILVASLLLLSTLNGILFLPVLLSVLGPPAEVRPLNRLSRMPTPSPPARRRIVPPLAPRPPPPAPSLTTITEEPASWRSSAHSVRSSIHSIRMQPEVVLETEHLTATANIKLEVVERPCRRHRERSSRRRGADSPPSS